ncbi:MAG: hypothetical protein Q4P13_06810 [Psychrobacter sp.]|nr:hypothetical protein [Psychrobacter sp.]
MRLSVVLSKIVCGASLGIMVVTGASANDDTCMQLMYHHGLATSAQLNCRYEYYNQNVINEAGMCMSKAKDFGADDAMESALRAGLSDFQYQFDEVEDKQAICTAFLNEFNDFVSN